MYSYNMYVYCICVYLFALFNTFPCVFTHWPSKKKRERLTALAQLSFEWKTLKELKFDDVINDFATHKHKNQTYKMIIK